MDGSRTRRQVAVIGGGFCGLAAAYELGRLGCTATVFEQDAAVGGLAGSFPVNGVRLEKFYHHWFTSDVHVMELIAELGKHEQVVLRETNTGVYYGNRFFKLSNPIDLLRFTPLSLPDRLRLGALALRARRVRDWQSLEEKTAAEWLREMCGDRVYEVVWEPLLRGKFGDVAEDVSAVWFWNKLKLRGGSRRRSGGEQLAYFRGGFAALADAVSDAVRRQGGAVHTGVPVTALQVDADRVTGVVVGGKAFPADCVIATTALPIFADLVEPHTSADYVASLRRVRYLANICVVLQLDRTLSDTYWLNVNDPTFPFVGVIEHTNFESPATYQGAHIVYLSKYLPESDPVFAMRDDEFVDYALTHLRRMFPRFSTSWVLNAHVWRARYSQPIVERGYSKLIPERKTPLRNLFLATMCQVYPEDRGTNYAIREGRKVAKEVLAEARC
jgi:protoporphyrinogen oxidase